MTKYYYKVSDHRDRFIGIWDNISAMVGYLNEDEDSDNYYIYKIELGIDYLREYSPMYWWYEEFLNTPLAIEALKSGE